MIFTSLAVFLLNEFLLIFQLKMSTVVVDDNSRRTTLVSDNQNTDAEISEHETIIVRRPGVHS